MDYKNRFEYIFFRVVLAIHKVLPYPLAEGKLRLLGFIGSQVPWLRRKVVIDNLRATYPRKSEIETRQLSRRIYNHLAVTVAETFLAPQEDLLSGISVEPGWDVLNCVIAEGKGVILATAHVGNFELGGRILAKHCSLLDVIKPQRNGLFDQYLKTMRLENGIETVPMAKAIKPVLQHLKNRGVVSLLLDQDAGRHGVRVPFLGQPASTWPGAAHIAIRTGAPVIPVALLRIDRWKYVLKFGEPLHPQQWQDTPEDVVAFTAQISRAVETYIEAYPDQWFWVHRRWKGASEAREL